MTDLGFIKTESHITFQGVLVKERTASLYNAQRKVKGLKQQLEQKELHMSLQRQKTAALEERISRLTQVINQPIRARYLVHVTGNQPITDQYFLIRSVH